MTQTDFFDILGEDGDRETVSKAQGVVFRLESGAWQAEIRGGWWVAVGSTREGAIKSVSSQYNREVNSYGF